MCIHNEDTLLIRLGLGIINSYYLPLSQQCYCFVQQIIISVLIASATLAMIIRGFIVDK